METIKVDLSGIWTNPSQLQEKPLNTETVNETIELVTNVPDSVKKTKKEKKSNAILKLVHNEKNAFEIGIDEAGRGPMFGRLYVAGVVLPKDGFDVSSIKDSKKYTSKKKIREVYDHIKKHAVAYHVDYMEPSTIDKINIRQSVLKSMRECAKIIMEKLEEHKISSSYVNRFFIMVDGDDFIPYTKFNESTNILETIPHDTFVGGDREYVNIAAASILAKVDRDDYILELCKQYPLLIERYGMDTHMGYGTKKHLNGISEHGITQFHRKSYGCCKKAKLNNV